MPLVAAGGGLSALGSALLGGAAAAAGIGGSILAQKKQAKHEKELATINRSEPGFVDLSDQLSASAPPPNLSLKNPNPFRFRG